MEEELVKSLLLCKRKRGNVLDGVIKMQDRGQTYRSMGKVREISSRKDETTEEHQEEAWVRIAYRHRANRMCKKDHQAWM